jgi:PAS domain S-box-containing protein
MPPHDAADIITQERQYRLLVDSVTDYAIYLLDTTGVVSSWNAGAVLLKGYEASEIIGRDFALFYTPQDRQAGLPEAALAASARDGSFATECWRVRRDGSRFWADTVIGRICDDDGSLLGFTTVTRDITKRWNAQVAMARAREALFESRKTEAIGRLSAGVAHDFNNLLQGIMGGLEMVLADIDTRAPEREFIDIAFAAAQRGAALTQSLLSYAHRQRLRPQQIVLAPFLSDLRTLLAGSLNRYFGVEVVVDANLAVLADPSQFKTALFQLAMNAAHAMAHGGVIHISAFKAEGERGDDSIAIVVNDTGSGMDAATLSRACEPFFTTKGVRGSGRGLSMVKGFTEQSGGMLIIDSEPGRGTSVEMRLPAASIRPPPAVAPDATLRRVLLVDDSMDVLVAIGAFLEKAKFEVIRATSGHQALALLSNGERFDALVSDLAMPGLNGADLIAEVHTLQPGLPAVMITGYGGTAYVDLLPADAVIMHKPFHSGDLRDALRRVMAPHTPPHTPGRPAEGGAVGG